MKFLLPMALLIAGCTSQPMLLTNAHAHNDYKHMHPLFDALGAGFCSVEADIWLVGDQLLVAHELAETQPDRTLQKLYLDPLCKFVSHDSRPITLLIEIKSNPQPTYAKLREV